MILVGASLRMVKKKKSEGLPWWCPLLSTISWISVSTEVLAAATFMPILQMPTPSQREPSTDGDLSPAVLAWRLPSSSGDEFPCGKGLSQ